MKKILIASLLLVSFLLIGQLAKQPSQVQASGGCSLVITHFDEKVYDPGIVENILYKQFNLIKDNEFYTAVDKGQFPFIIEGNQNDLQNALDVIISNVCEGNCDSKAFDISLSCDGSSSSDCSLTINYFDQNVYDPNEVDHILSKIYGLINAGDFINAVGKKQFPFVINGNQNDLQDALNLIISNVCEGNCDSNAFDISLSCDGSSSSDCSLTINYFDQNVYDPSEVDGILFGKYGLIGKGEFNNAVGKKQFPFVINGNQNDLQDALNLIISDVCKGNCDSKAFDISLSCDGSGSKTCHIKFTAFDTDRYSAETVDGILSSKDLYDSNNFFYDVKNKEFPIVTKTDLQERLKQTMVDISLKTCNGNCHALSLAMFLECEDGTVVLPPLVSYEISEGVSGCQKGIYSLIRENVNNYSEKIRANNIKYYAASASTINSFRQRYLNTKDDKERKALVEQYVFEINDLKEKNNYKLQAEATKDYFELDKGYKEVYMRCPSY